MEYCGGPDLRLPAHPFFPHTSSVSYTPPTHHPIVCLAFLGGRTYMQFSPAGLPGVLRPTRQLHLLPANQGQKPFYLPHRTRASFPLPAHRPRFNSRYHWQLYTIVLAKILVAEAPTKPEESQDRITGCRKKDQARS